MEYIKVKDGFRYYNETKKLLASTIATPKFDNTQWKEITIEEAKALELQWEKEVEELDKI